MDRPERTPAADLERRRWAHGRSPDAKIAPGARPDRRRDPPHPRRHDARTRAAGLLAARRARWPRPGPRSPSAPPRLLPRRVAARGPRARRRSAALALAGPRRCCGSAGLRDARRATASTPTCRAGRSRRWPTARRSAATIPARSAVWQAHVARMRRRAAAARAALPDLRLSRDDPWALRLVALVALIAALVFARGDAVAGLGAARSAPSGRGGGRDRPELRGLGRAARLHRQADALSPRGRPPSRRSSVPQGSVVTVRVYGDAAEASRSTETVSGAAAPALAEAAGGIAVAQFDGDAQRLGHASAEGGTELGAWSFAMSADDAARDRRSPNRSTGRRPARPNSPTSPATTTASSAARAEIALDLAGRRPPLRPRRRARAARPARRRPAAAARRATPADVAETLVEDFSEAPLGRAAGHA